MATTVKKTVTQTSSSSSKGMGNVKPVAVSQPTVPADYKQSTYKQAATYKPAATYKANTYKSGYQQGTYKSKYQPQIDTALDKVVNWKYDPMADANYQALAQVYNAQGNLAAKNSLADAAALNGGYGTSYAASAAQQARNQYNQQLAAMIPELEQTAYQRAQGTYNALMDADNTQYGRFRDTEQDKQWKESHNLNVFNTNEDNRYRAAAYNEDNRYKAATFNEDSRYKAASFNEDNRYRAASFNEDNRYRAASFNQNERQFAYNALLDKYNTLNSNYWQGLNYNYQLDRDRVSDQQWALEYALSQQNLKSSGGGGGSGGSRKRSSGGGGGYTAPANNIPITKDDLDGLKDKKKTTNHGSSGYGGARSTMVMMKM